KTLQAPHPNHWRAVKCVEESAVENIPEFRIILGFTDAMNAADANVATVALFDRLGNQAGGQIQVDGANAHTQDIGPWRGNHFKKPKWPAADAFRGSVSSAGACSRFGNHWTVRKRRLAP